MMRSRYLLFVIGVCLASLVVIWAQGGITFHRGPLPEPVPDGPAAQVTGTLLISPYGVEEEIVDILSATKYSLDTWMYQLTYDKLLTLLKNIAYMGAKVTILLENQTFGGSSKEYEKAVNILAPKGVDFYTDDALGTNFVHAKTIIMDDANYIISTANLSFSSFWKNREYRFVGYQPDIAASLAVLFEKDTAGEPLSPDDVHPALVVCPLDCRAKIVDALEDAQSSIRIAAQYIEDRGIVDLLEKKQQQGVAIQLLVGKFQEEGWLDFAGTGVRIYDADYLHAKNILIDDHALLMGSMNLSTNALDNNREIGIIIDDPTVIEEFSEQFSRDWEVSG